jgi:malonate transporter
VGQILGSVIPLFAIIALGKLAIQYRFLDPAGTVALSRFALFLLVPALLFGLIAEAPTADMFGVGGVYLVGCLIMYVVALILGLLLKEPSLGHSAIFALDSTFGNITFLGVPLVLSMYGAEGVNLLVGMIIFTTVMLPLTTILLEVGNHQEGSGYAKITETLTGFTKNPIIVSVVFGFLWRMTGWGLPSPVHVFIDLFAKAAAPIALFCVGTSLPAISWGVSQEAFSATFIKLIALPALIAVLCYWLGFRGLDFAVPVFASALPTGANAFLLARGATEHGSSSATTVVIATTLSLITLSLLLFGLRTVSGESAAY